MVTFVVSLASELILGQVSRHLENEKRVEAVSKFYSNIYKNLKAYDSKYNEELENFINNNKKFLEEEANKIIKEDILFIISRLYLENFKKNFLFFLIFCVILHKILKDIQK